MADVPIETWRDHASEIRLDVLDHLSEYVDTVFLPCDTGRGHHTSSTGQRKPPGSLSSHSPGSQARKIVKAKSMITEEIHLNEYLEDQDFQVVETDLGEYIVQIAGEKPSHILAPAIHKTRSQVGELFSEKLNVPYSDDPTVLTKIARNVLRQEFLAADAGISGPFRGSQVQAAWPYLPTRETGGWLLRCRHCILRRCRLRKSSLR